MHWTHGMAYGTARGTGRRAVVALAALLAGATAGCSGLTDVGGKAALPSGTQDPGSFKNPAGALQMYWATVAQFQPALGFTQYVGGLLTDEFGAAGSGDVSIDRRKLPEGTDNLMTSEAYGALQTMRAYALQARGALAKYNPTAPAALRGHLYALEGYADVYLADLFCSGVPLSELEFEGDFTYKPSSTTQQVYARAVALFDSALALSADSARIMNFARVGKARALAAMSRDSLAAAARVVAGVPTDFAVLSQAICNASIISPGTIVTSCLQQMSVSDREGQTGLPYRSSGDPRTTTFTYSSPWLTAEEPVKFGSPDAVPNVRAAGGVEARLIEAEAALQAGQVSTWLSTLNALRTDGTYTTAVRYDAQTGDSVGVDTTWNAGTGGIAGLRPLTDPGTAAARVDLTFAERAYWLFGEAQRQGDLRRLVRQYGRTSGQAYPVGVYLDGTSIYGSDVTIPVPTAEEANPLFHGCFNRGG